jgi:glycosyltransferase involved in cell wall biosynthesis
MRGSDTVQVLFVSNAYPWPLDNGSVLRTFHLVSALAARHRVTMVAQTRNGENTAPESPLHALCERIVVVDNSDVLGRPGGPFGLWRPIAAQLKDAVLPGLPVAIRRWWSDPLVDVLTRLRQTEQYDIVWAERPAQAEAARRAGWTEVVVDLADLDSEALGRALQHNGWYTSRPLHQLDLHRLRSYETALSTRFAHVTVCKQDDRERLNNRPNVSVVPNGVSARPAVDPNLARAHEMLFVGTMGYEPNADAVTYFMRDIMPEVLRQQPDARLSIVGKEAFGLVQTLHDGRTCIVHGPVPEVTPYYESADVVVAPIRLGAGTRLKVLEALMFGKAVVATSMAVEGLDLRAGVDLEVADTASQFGTICLELMRDKLRRQRLGQSGRARALDRYEWSKIGELADSVVTRTVQRRRPTTADAVRFASPTTMAP